MTEQTLIPRRAYCPTCADDTLARDNGSCSWCDTPIPAAPEPAPVQPGRSVGIDWLTDRQVRDAHAAHLRGASLGAIARALHPDTRYSSPATLAGALSTEWHHRGWYVRPRVEATVKASTTHGRAARGHHDPEHQRALKLARGETRGVMCAAIKTRYGKGRGEPCQRAALAGDDYCIAHSPARAEQRRAHLAAARARVVRTP